MVYNELPFFAEKFGSLFPETTQEKRKVIEIRKDFWQTQIRGKSLTRD